MRAKARALRIVDGLTARATSQAIREAATDFAARLRAGRVDRTPTPAR